MYLVEVDVTLLLTADALKPIGCDNPADILEELKFEFDIDFKPPVS